MELFNFIRLRRLRSHSSQGSICLVFPDPLRAVCGWCNHVGKECPSGISIFMSWRDKYAFWPRSVALTQRQRPKQAKRWSKKGQVTGSGNLYTPWRARWRPWESWAKHMFGVSIVIITYLTGVLTFKTEVESRPQCPRRNDVPWEIN